MKLMSPVSWDTVSCFRLYSDFLFPITLSGTLLEQERLRERSCSLDCFPHFTGESGLDTICKNKMILGKHFRIHIL